ncbi:MAG TPA: hypothetical protein VIH86_05080 [Puia sp.]
MRKSVLLSTVIIFCLSVKAQLAKTDMCEFSVKLYERKMTNYGYGNPKFPGTFSMSIGNYTYIGADAISTYFMQQAFQDFNPNSVKQRFGNLCASTSDFDRFIYQVLIECEGQQQMFDNLISAFCGNRTLATKFYNHLIIKYGKKLSSDIAKLKNKDKAGGGIDDKTYSKDQIKDSSDKYEGLLNEYYRKIKLNNTLQSVTKIADGLADDPQESIFNIPELSIKIFPNAKIVNAVDNSFEMQLQIRKDYYIDKVSYIRYGLDLVVLAEFDDGEEGYSSIQCLNLKAKKTKWSIDLKGFNLSQGVVENNYVYVSTIGEIAKLNLITGKIMWKHENLYEKYKCNNFCEIKIADNWVRFTGVNDKGKKIGDARFDELINFKCEKISGKIISIDKTIRND